MRWSVVGALAAWLTVRAAAASAQAYADHPHYWGDGWGWWGMMIVGPLMMIAFVGAIIAVVVLVIRWLGGTSGSGAAASGRNRALDILDERFARGEIEREEYLQRKQDLS